MHRFHEQIKVEEWGKGKVWPSICGGINSLSACLLNRIELFFYIESMNSIQIFLSIDTFIRDILNYTLRDALGSI